jgi:hypothetical protein
MLRYCSLLKRTRVACLAALEASSMHGMPNILLQSHYRVLVNALKSNLHDQAIGGVLFRDAKYLKSTQFHMPLEIIMVIRMNLLALVLGSISICYLGRSPPKVCNFSL